MSPATVQKIAPYQKFRFHATRLSKNIPAQHPAPTIGRCENRWPLADWTSDAHASQTAVNPDK